jgi:hypothetical protein
MHEYADRYGEMSEWGFLSNHARMLVCIARDPEVRLRDIGATIGITERRAYDIVDDLAQTGHIVKKQEGRRNSYPDRSMPPWTKPLVGHRRSGGGGYSAWITKGQKAALNAVWVGRRPPMCR